MSHHERVEAVFACPFCEGTDFQLRWRTPLNPQSIAEATEEHRGMLTISMALGDGPLHSYCVTPGCEFWTSITEIELAMTSEHETKADR